MPRILVVDDARHVREPLARLLEAAGQETVTAANGRDAWLTLYEGLPDLILLDLMMPQMDGITFLRLLRRSDHWSHLPVIVVTGFADDRALVAEARELGVEAIVQKSDSSVDELIALVQRTLRADATPTPRRPAENRRSRRTAVSV